MPREPRFLHRGGIRDRAARSAARIVPQPGDRPPIPVAALVDRQAARRTSATAIAMPGMPRDARGLAARLARARCGSAKRAWRRASTRSTPTEQDALLQRMQQGELRPTPHGAACRPSDLLQATHAAATSCVAYYAHPTAWSEIGWGGPASPRGYVRMGFDRARSLGSGRSAGRRR